MSNELDNFIKELHKEARIRKRGFSPSKANVYPSNDKIASKIEVFFKLGYNIKSDTPKKIRQGSRLDSKEFRELVTNLLFDENILNDDTQINKNDSASTLEEVPLFSGEQGTDALAFFYKHYHNLEHEVHEGHVALHDPELYVQLHAEGAFERGKIRSFKAVFDDRRAMLAEALALPENAMEHPEIKRLLAASLTEQGKWTAHVLGRENTSAPAPLFLPEKAPVLWNRDTPVRDVPDFIKEHYQPWLRDDGSGIVRTDLKQLDPDLYEALNGYLKNYKLPDDCPVPPLKVRNSYLLAQMEQGEGNWAEQLKELDRLRSVKERRRQRE